MRSIPPDSRLLTGLAFLLLCAVPLSRGENSFWGVDGHMSNPMVDFAHLDKCEEAGVTEYGIEFLNWGTVVLSEDTAALGPAFYDWRYPDAHVREIEAVGGSALFKIWCRAPWATGHDTTTGHLWPPKTGPDGDSSRYWDYWGVFCRELVERYDHDGIGDMGWETPQDTTDDLDHAHLLFQIQGESEWRWLGEDSEYVDLLHIAHDSMHSACDEVQVLYSSFNLGNLFDANLSLEQMRAFLAAPGQEKMEFIYSMLTDPQNFEIAPTQLNHDYTGIPSRVRWLRWLMQDSLGYDRPILLVDAMTSFPLNQQSVPEVPTNPHYQIDGLPAEIAAIIESHPDYQGPTWAQGIMVDILQRGELSGVTSEDYHLLKDWWEADKACYAFKKTVLTAAFDVEGLYSQWILELEEPCIPYSGWGACGLLDDGVPDEEADEGTLRPVIHTLARFDGILGGFDSARALLPGAPELIDTLGVLWDETWLLSFDFGEEQTFVAWADGGADTLDLRAWIPAEGVIVSHIVTEVDDMGQAVLPSDEQVSADRVALSARPVFVREDPDSPPLAPQGLVIAVSADEVVLNWEAAAGASSYRVYSTGMPQGQFILDLSGEFDGSSWTAPLPDGNRMYRVTALR